jgi:hypothetical protein
MKTPLHIAFENPGNRENALGPRVQGPEGKSKGQQQMFMLLAFAF